MVSRLYLTAHATVPSFVLNWPTQDGPGMVLRDQVLWTHKHTHTHTPGQLRLSFSGLGTSVIKKAFFGRHELGGCWTKQSQLKIHLLAFSDDTQLSWICSLQHPKHLEDIFVGGGKKPESSRLTLRLNAL